MSSTTLSLHKTNDLTTVEIVLIQNIYTMINRREALIKTIIDNVEDYKKVIDAATELRYIDRYNGSLSELKDQFFEYAEPETLMKIVNEEKFTPMYNFQDAFTIDKRVIKEMRYGAEFKGNHPKATIAKKLGAKIVM